MTFRQAVEETSDIDAAYEKGLQALRTRDRRRIAAEDTCRISGSVNLDSALRRRFPDKPRWDYAVGYRPVNLDDEIVYWIEIHPANSGEIQVVLQKLSWLKTWLQQCAPSLCRLKAAYIWVSSGKTTLSPTALQRKKMALSGLRHKGSYFCIPNHAK